MRNFSQFDKVDHSDLIITSQSFGLLRKALFENMGKNKAKAFLMRFGQDLGAHKAKALMKENDSLEYLLEMSTITHIRLGHVAEVEHNDFRQFSESKQLAFKDSKGKWIDSFEVDLHLKHHGAAEECSCYTLSGYASGYLSTIFHEDVFVKEVTCRSKGDADCSFEVNTKDYWLQNSNDNLPIYDDQTIITELEVTYDKLLSQNNLLNKFTKYHIQLTDCVVQQNSIDNVVQTAYQILNIPIVLEDLNGTIISLYGIERETYQESILHNNKQTIPLHAQHRSSLVKNGQAHLLRTPIYVDNKVFATCSFIYLESQLPNENDYLFLERLSTVSTLCFLNEKIGFETTERLKVSILDRLINKQYHSINEITSQLKYVTPNLAGPFVTLSIKCDSKKSPSSPIDLYDQLLQLSKALKKYFLDGLLSQHKNGIVILVFSVKDLSSFLKQMKHAISHSEKINKDILYKIGISQLFHDLSHFEISLKQAEQAVCLPSPKKIVQFDELGLLGTLIQGTNVVNLIKTGKRELGMLLEPNEKNKELLHTLYIYLVNGGKLEKTMHDLSLSIGGIQYRIRKIEKMIHKDLKDSYSASYLLLLIESLILIGEIQDINSLNVL